MNPGIFERLFAAIVISGLGVAIYLLANRLILSKAGSKVKRFAAYQSGHPTIVYFTTPTCAPCKTVQRPAIESLKRNLGEWLQVIEVDASVEPELAQNWGVLSVPTTFIIDSEGTPRHVNHGVATAEKLTHQLEDFEI
jgi:thioredoxin-like negative regulator of GroEL